MRYGRNGYGKEASETSEAVEIVQRRSVLSTFQRYFRGLAYLYSVHILQPNFKEDSRNDDNDNERVRYKMRLRYDICISHGYLPCHNDINPPFSSIVDLRCNLFKQLAGTRVYVLIV